MVFPLSENLKCFPQVLGKYKSKINLLDRIDEYNESVDAISCLTEEDHFDGNVDYLEKDKDDHGLPILRKDFMIDPYQFYEAKRLGQMQYF